MDAAIGNDAIQSSAKSILRSVTSETGCEHGLRRHRFGNYVQATTTAAHRDVFGADGCLATAVAAGMIDMNLRDQIRAHIYAAQALSSEAAGLVLEALALVPAQKQVDESSEIMLRNTRSVMRDMLVHHICAQAGGFDSKPHFLRLFWQLSQSYPDIVPPRVVNPEVKFDNPISSQLQNAYSKLLREYLGWLDDLNFKNGESIAQTQAASAGAAHQCESDNQPPTLTKSAQRRMKKKARDAFSQLPSKAEQSLETGLNTASQTSPQPALAWTSILVGGCSEPLYVVRNRGSCELTYVRPIDMMANYLLYSPSWFNVFGVPEFSDS